MISLIPNITPDEGGRYVSLEMKVLAINNSRVLCQSTERYTPEDLAGVSQN